MLTLTRVVLEHRLFERFGPDGQKIRDAVGSPGGWADLLAMFAQEVARHALPDRGPPDRS